MALAAPAEKDGFSYAGDSLYCEASNLNRHRRATQSELKAHFNGKDLESRPAHWYEAQLIHYGLPPSKVKGTAHKRLFDAVMANRLSVPYQIQRIEADLKKEWAKREREAKKILKESAATEAPKGTKRKASQVSADVNVNVSVHVSNTGAVKVQTSQAATKRAKTSTPRSTAAASQGRKIASPAKPAKASRSTFSGSGSAGVDLSAFGRCYGAYDDAGYGPPPYSEFEQDRTFGSQEYQQPSPQPRIGLLNGRYQVECDLINDNFPEYMGDFSLIATLDGSGLWLKFDFGAITGMMSLGRPYETGDRMGMFWRGYSVESSTNRRFYNIDTSSRSGPLNFIEFLGDGHIRGSLQRTGLEAFEFDAYRLPGQSMTSEISPTMAREEWARLGQNMDMSW